MNTTNRIKWMWRGIAWKARVAMAVLLTASLQAQDGTWTDGAGDWGAAGHWSGGTIADGAGSTADFSTLDITADTTVHLESSRTIGNLIFGDALPNSVAGWILDNNSVDGNVLTLAGGTPTITVNPLGGPQAATISAILGGSAGLVKAGAGTLILTGTNIYGGGTTINSGTLQIKGTYRYYRFTPTKMYNGAAGLIQMGELQYFQGTTWVPAVSTSLSPVPGTIYGPVDQLNDNITTDFYNKLCNDSPFSSIIYDFGAPVAFTQYNWSTGGDTSSYPERNPVRWTVQGSFDGSAWVMLDDRSGADQSVSFADSTWAAPGNTRFSGWSLANIAAGNNVLPGGGAVTVNGGTLDLGTTRAAVGDVALVSGMIHNGALSGTSYAVQSGTISAALTGTGIGLTKSGAGTVALSGENTYGGGTTINAGTLQIKNGYRYYRFTPTKMHSAGLIQMGELQYFQGNAWVPAVGTSLSPAPGILFNGTSDTLNDNIMDNKLCDDSPFSSITYDFGVPMAFTQYNWSTGGDTSVSTERNPVRWTVQGSLDGIMWVMLDDKSGADQSVSFADNTWAAPGNSRFSGWALANVAAGNNVLPDAGSVSVTGEGTLDLDGKSETVGAVTLIGGTIRNGTLTGTAYAVQGGTIAASLAGEGGLTKTGGGVLTVTAAATYTGATVISNGTLRLLNNPEPSLSAISATPAVWLDAGDVYGNGGTPADGAIVSVWTNKATGAAAAGHFTLNTAAGVSYNANSRVVGGGKPAVHFDGSGLLATDTDIQGAFSIFYVGGLSGWKSERLVGSYSANWLLGYWANRMNCTYFNGAGRYNSGNAVTPPDAAAHVWGGTSDGSTYHSYRMDAYGGEWNYDTGSGGNGPGRLVLGGGYNGIGLTGESSAGDLSEVLVFNGVLSDADRTAVEAYLQSKWLGTTQLYGHGSLSTNTALSIVSGASLDLGGMTQTVSRLYMNGNEKVAGTYGAPGSGAAKTYPGYFTGSGILKVLNGNPTGTLIMIN